VPEVPPPRKATTAEARALAHPLRLHLIELLREGPSTASRLARDLGESSGSTSYHLRALARAGLIEEDPTPSRGRERWWRRTEDFILVDFDPEDAEGRALEAKLRAECAALDEEALRRFTLREPDLGVEWRRAAFVGSWNLHLTPDEATEFSLRFTQLLREAVRRREERPPEARRVLVTYRAVPWIE
jgi:DNA-binding transcriptional ArsR family regulator